MKASMRRMFCDVTPPLVLRWLRLLRPAAVSWHGDHPSWQSAAAACAGYDHPAIIEQVAQSTARVLAGVSAFERDGVCFDAPDPNWPLLAALQRIAMRARRLSVCDFGGALGSTWLQCRPDLPDEIAVTWGVVEQPAFVTRGRALFPGGLPSFHDDLHACWREVRPEVCLLSGVLQYLPDPDALVEDLVRLAPRWIIIDRTPVWSAERDRYTVQRVRPPIYQASYPCRIFARDRLEILIERLGRVRWRFGSLDRCNLPGVSFGGCLVEKQA